MLDLFIHAQFRQPATSVHYCRLWRVLLATSLYGQESTKPGNLKVTLGSCTQSLRPSVRQEIVPASNSP